MTENETLPIVQRLLKLELDREQAKNDLAKISVDFLEAERFIAKLRTRRNKSIVKAHSFGVSVVSIASILGVDRATVQKVLDKNKVIESSESLRLEREAQEREDDFFENIRRQAEQPPDASS